MNAIVSKILETYLSDFLESDRQKASLNLVTGNCVLTDLTLRQHALDTLFPEIPFMIREGSLGELKIHIPWTHIKTQPVEVYVSRLNIVLVPKKGAEWDEEGFQERLERRKRLALEQYENRMSLVQTLRDQHREELAAEEAQAEEERVRLADEADKLAEDEFLASGGAKRESRSERRERLKRKKARDRRMRIRKKKVRREDRIRKRGEKARAKKRKKIPIVETLIETVINNIRIIVSDCVIRYEDRLDPRRTISADITLDGVSIVSTDEEYEETFQRKVGPVTYKLAGLQGLSMKMSINDGEPQALFENLRGFLKIRMQSLALQLDFTQPLFFAQVCFDEALSISLSDLQYKSFLKILEYAGTFSRFERFRRYRPASFSPRAYWKFALHALLHEKRKKFYPKTGLEGLRLAIRDRDRYIELYKLTLGNVVWERKTRRMNGPEKKELAEIVDRRGLQCILLWRNMARIEADAQRELYKAKKAALKAAPRKKRLIKKKRKVDRHTLALTKEDRFRLYKEAFADLNDFDLSLTALQKVTNQQQAGDEEDAPPLVAFQLDVNVELVSLSLRAEDWSPIAEARIGGVKADVSFEGNGLDATAGVQFIEILDHITPAFPKMLQSREASDSEEGDLLSVTFSKRDELISVDFGMTELWFVFNMELVKKVVSFFLVHEIPDFQQFSLFKDIEKMTSQGRSIEELARGASNIFGAPLAIESSDDDDDFEEEEEEGEGEVSAAEPQEVLPLKFKLDVRIKAPIIFIPVDASTTDGAYFKVDTGVLNVTKAYERDTIEISLANLIISSPETPILAIAPSDPEMTRILDNVAVDVDLSYGPEGIDIVVHEKPNKVEPMRVIIGPTKASNALRVLDQVIKFASNPFATATLSGEFVVTGPITKDSKPERLRVEVNTTLKQLGFFPAGSVDNENPRGYVRLGTGVDFGKDDQERVLVILNQPNGRVLTFTFETDDPALRKDLHFYVGIMSFEVEEHKKQILRRKRLEAAKKGVDVEEEEGEGEEDGAMFSTEAPASTLAISVGFQMPRVTALLHDDSNREILSLAMKEIEFKGGNDVGLFGGRFTLYNVEVLGPEEMKIISLADLEVKLSVDEEISVEAAFDKVTGEVKQVLLVRLVDMGYDILETVDTLSIGLQQNFAQGAAREEVGDLNLKLRISLGDVDVGVALRDRRLMTAKLARSSVGFDLTKDGFSLACALNGLTVLDNGDPDSLYQEIVRPMKADDSFFTFKMKSLTWAKVLEVRNTMSLELSSLRYTHNQRLVSDMIVFALDIFKRMVKREGSRPHRRASMADPMKPPIYFPGIDLILKDLSVFVPVSPKSESGLVVSLPSLVIGSEVEDNKKVVVFHIDLSELGVSGMNRSVSVPCIPNVSLAVHAKIGQRPLDYPNPQFPSMDLSVTIPQLTGVVTPTFVMLGLGVVVENILPGLSTVAASAELQMIALLVKFLDYIQIFDPPDLPDDFVDQKIRVDLAGASLQIWDRNERPFLDLALNQVSVGGTAFGDKSKRFDVSTGLAMIDKQEKENHYREFFQTSTIAVQFIEEVISKGDETHRPVHKKNIILRLPSPQVVITMPLIFGFVDFALDADLLNVFSKLNMGEKQVALEEEKPEGEGGEEEEEEEEKEDLSAPLLDMNFDIAVENPSVSIVEDCASTSSRMFRLSTIVTAQINIHEEVPRERFTRDGEPRDNNMVISGAFAIRNLSAGIRYDESIYKPILYDLGFWTVDVAEGADPPLYLSLSKTAIKVKLLCEVISLPDRTVSISYTDVRMVVGMILQYIEKAQPLIESIQKMQPQFEELKETARRHSRVAKELSATIVENQKKAVQAVATLGAAVCVRTTNFHLELVDDAQGFRLPILKAEVFLPELLVVNAALDEKQNMILCTALQLNIMANFYNDYRNVYEPMLEKLQDPIAFDVNVAMNLANLQDMRVEAVGSIPSQIRLSITHRMIGKLISLAMTWIEQEEYTVDAHLARPSFGVRNTTGLPMQFFLPGDATAVPIGDSIIDFDLGTTSSSPDAVAVNASEFEARFIFNSCEFRLPIQSVRRFAIKAQETMAFASIRIEKGQKIVDVHSGKRVVNRCQAVTFQVGLLTHGRNTIHTLGELAPGDAVNVSLAALEGRYLTFRPKADGDKYSYFPHDDGMFTSRLFQGVSEPQVRCFANKHDSMKPFYVVQSVELVDEDMCLILRTPMLFSNLLCYAARLFFFYSLEDTRTPDLIVRVEEGQTLDMHELDVSRPLFMCLRTGGFHNGNPVQISRGVRRGRVSPTVTCLDSKERDRREMQLALDYEYDGPRVHVRLFSRFWIIDHTEIPGLTIHSTTRGRPELAGLRLRESEGKPVMTAVPKIFLRVGADPKNSFCRKPIPISVLNKSQETMLGIRSVGVFGKFGPGHYSRTRIVHLTPRYYMVNATNEELFVRQSTVGEHRAVTLQPEQKGAFYWENRNHQNFKFRLDSTMWSTGTFLLDRMCEMVTLLNRRGKAPQPVAMHIEESEGSIYVTFTKTESPPFEIDNRTTHLVRVHQADESDPVMVEVPGAAIASYDLQNHYSKQIVIVECGSTFSKIDLSKLGETAQIELPSAQLNLHISALARGRKLTITAGAPSKEEALAPKPMVFFSFDIEEVTLSLINHVPSEVLFVSVEGIRARGRLSTTTVLSLCAVVQNVQVDHQSPGAIYPVIFFNKRVLAEVEVESEGEDEVFVPFVQVDLEFNLAQVEFIHLPLLTFTMQEGIFRGDMSFVEVMAGFADELIHYIESFQDVEAKKTKALESAHQPTSKITKYLQLEELTLQPIAITITFTMLRSENADNDRFMGKSVALATLIRLASSLNANIEDVCLRLKAITIEHGFLSVNELVGALQKHYVANAALQWYKFVGAIDLIGNPVGLFNDVGVGFVGIFREPIVGGRRAGVGGFFKGVGRGISQAAGRGAHGIGGLAGTALANLGDSVRMLAFDEDYLLGEKRRRVQDRASGVGKGLLLGGKSLVGGFVSGVKGVVAQPIQGAKKDGVGGLVSGFMRGIAGAVVKPIAGGVDMLQRTAEGVKNQGMKQTTVPTRRPRRVLMDGILERYRPGRAYIMSRVHAIKAGAFLRDAYVDHARFDERVLVVTDRHCLLFRNLGRRGEKLLWVLVPKPSEAFLLIAKGEQKGLEITLAQRQKIGLTGIRGYVTKREVLTTDDGDFRKLNSLHKRMTLRGVLAGTIIGTSRVQKRCELWNSCPNVGSRHLSQYQHPYRKICPDYECCLRYFDKNAAHCRQHTHICLMGVQCKNINRAACQHNIHMVLPMCQEKDCRDMSLTHRQTIGHVGLPCVLKPCPKGRNCPQLAKWQQTKGRRRVDARAKKHMELFRHDMARRQ